MVKQTMLLPYDFDKVVLSVLPYQHTEEFDPAVLKVKLLEHFSYEDLEKKGYKMRSKRGINVACTDAKAYYEIIKILKCFTSTSIEYYPEREELCQVTKPYAHSSFKEEGEDINWKKDLKNTHYYNKNNEKIENVKAAIIKVCTGYFYKKIDENKTLYSQIIIADSKGMLGDYILKKEFHNRGILLRKSLIEQCKKFKNSISLSNYDKYKEDANSILLYNLNIPYQRKVYENKMSIKEKSLQKQYQNMLVYEEDQIQIDEFFETIEISEEDQIDDENETKEIPKKLILNQKYFEKTENNNETLFKLILKKIIMLDDISGFIFLSNHKIFSFNIKYENGTNLLHLSSKFNANQIFIHLIQSGIKSKFKTRKNRYRRGRQKQ
jgi:hypothetical protein